MKTKILRNIFASFGMLFAFAMLLAAGIGERVSNFNSTPLGPWQTVPLLNPLLARAYAKRNLAEGTRRILEAAVAAKAAQSRAVGNQAALNSASPNTTGTFITFDVPGSVTGTTAPSSINPAGEITGSYCDAITCHGFVRARDGTFTTFDVPGSISTQPYSINTAGAVVGAFSDVNFMFHGFVRDNSGSFVVFDVPDAQFFYLALAINPAGVVVGTFFDVNFVPHGFVRAKNGAINTIDVPGAVNGTEAVAINPEGVITGIYVDANSIGHGYLRDRDGAITTFDPPVPGFIDAFAPFSYGPDLSITPEGVITGTYFEFIAGNPFGGNFRVFVRATDGTFTTFDAATYPPCCIWSFPSGTNPAGTITGSFNDGFTINHGYLRASDGTITTFDVPGAGTGFNQGTAPLGITPGGVIMGLYIDENYGVHGFLRTP